MPALSEVRVVWETGLVNDAEKYLALRAVTAFGVMQALA
jgi:hypothetical protein